MIKPIRSGRFERMLKDLLKDRGLELAVLIDNKITLFSKNPKDTRLRNHRLTGKMSGQFAFSITEDIRIVYEIIGKNTIRFLAIGTHEKVY